MESARAGEFLLFEGCCFDRQARRLFRQAATGAWLPVSLGQRALDVLALLLERPGTLVSKEALMDAVWSNVAVGQNNLTVQISALRQALDHGKTGGSCIQTIPGRGYRFAAQVLARETEPRPAQPRRVDSIVSDEASGTGLDGRRTVTVPNDEAAARRRRLATHLAALLGGICLAIGALAVLGLGHAVRLAAPPHPPRLAVVVLPFENLRGDTRDDYLADAITDDLTGDLSRITGAFVISRQSAYTYKGKREDVRTIGRELGVRYVVDGSMRRLDASLSINVQLTSAETGALLWSDRFNEQITDLPLGQERIVARMRTELGISMVDIESARSVHERPTHPDAFDLVLRAHSLEHQPPSLQRYDKAQALYERALLLDPSSVPALIGIGFILVAKAGSCSSWGAADIMQRADRLLTQARSITPYAEGVLNLTAQWAQLQGRYRESIAVAEEIIRRYPNNEAGYFDLAQGLINVGHAEEAIQLEEKAIRLNPRSPWLYARYRDMGRASLLLGKDEEAINFLERSLATNSDDNGDRRWLYRWLAVAYARTGEMPKARHALAEADRLWPYDTVRMHWPRDPSSSVYAEQVRRFQDGLRLAGERDHADEDSDFGVPEDGTLHSDFAGLTPMSAPGARTIRTEELTQFVAKAEVRPIIVDTVSYSWGRSLPGAIGLQNAGLGGSLIDANQGRLGRQMHELTKGDLSTPIIAVGWNAERFDGRNLALRLVALGYTEVYWYRGGREAWEAASLPETSLTLQVW